MRTHRIVVIPGDGIGPEILEAALEVLRAVQTSSSGFTVELRTELAGAAQFQRTGVSITPEAVEACRRADGVLKAPVGLPGVRLADGTEAGMLGGVLRGGLDLYANLRPIKLWPGVRSAIGARPGQIDYAIVRENTEGLYASRGRGVVNQWAATDLLLMTRPGVERVVRFAFELARKRNGAPLDRVRRVTCVDKANVLRSFAFFRGIFQEIGAQYPDIEMDFLYADAAAQALVLDPSRFDVLVMENFLGDILSDLGGATIGGIGMCPSGNIGAESAYFEAIHGSAPTLAGRDLANPLGLILSLALLLERLNEPAAARQIEHAIWHALESGALTLRDDGSIVGGPHQAAATIVQHLGR